MMPHTSTRAKKRKKKGNGKESEEHRKGRDLFPYDGKGLLIPSPSPSPSSSSHSLSSTRGTTSTQRKKNMTEKTDRTGTPATNATPLSFPSVRPLKPPSLPSNRYELPTKEKQKKTNRYDNDETFEFAAKSIISPPCSTRKFHPQGHRSVVGTANKNNEKEKPMRTALQL